MTLDRGEFATLTGQMTQLDFEDQADSTYHQQVQYPGVTFHSLDADPQDLLVISPESYSFPALRSKVLLSNRNFHPVVMDFSATAGAVGLEGIRLPEGDRVVVTVEGNGVTESFEVLLAQGGPQFVGVVSNAGPITRVSVGNPEGVSEFVAVDNVCFGEAAGGGEEEDPLGDCLDRLAAAIQAGRADHSIRMPGQSLERKVQLAMAAAENARYRRAGVLVKALKLQIRAQRGKKITTAKADELMALCDECVAALEAAQQAR
jgi:hypothetical protein